MNILRIAVLSLSAVFLVACGGAAKKSYLNADGSSSIPPEKAYGYGVKELKRQQFDAAVALLEIASKQRDAGAEQFANLGVAYSRTEQYEDSLKALKKAVSLAPNNADVLNELGLVYHEQGDFAQSRKQYQRALSINPTHANVNFNLGVLCDLYKEDLDCAIKHYEQYLVSSGTDDKQVKVWLKDLAKRKKKKAAGGSQ